MADQRRIVNILLDSRTIVPRSAQIEHERRAAVFDLLEKNRFAPVGEFRGPYNLHLAIQENRLLFDVRDTVDRPLTVFTLPLRPFRALIRDYFVVCDSYYRAIKTLSASQIEAIDVGRRSLHDEGADRLGQRLADKVAIDLDTARRLFTLISALHFRR